MCGQFQLKHQTFWMFLCPMRKEFRGGYWPWLWNGASMFRGSVLLLNAGCCLHSLLMGFLGVSGLGGLLVWTCWTVTMRLAFAFAFLFPKQTKADVKHNMAGGMQACFSNGPLLLPVPYYLCSHLHTNSAGTAHLGQCVKTYWNDFVRRHFSLAQLMILHHKAGLEICS